jgi:hypothetical protein
LCISVGNKVFFAQVSAPVTSERSYWQLMPHILNADEEEPVHEFDYRLNGHWHIAQSFQGRQKCDVRGAQGRGAPLQVTFAPMFVRGGDEAARTEGLCESALGQINYALFLGMRLDIIDLRTNYDPVRFHALLRRCGMRLGTIQRLFGDEGRVRWCAGEEVPFYLARFVGYFYLAREEKLMGLQRRIVRAMVSFDDEVIKFAGITDAAKEIAINEFWSNVLGAKQQEWAAPIPPQPAGGAIVPVLVVAPANAFLFADAGAAFAGIGALGAEAAVGAEAVISAEDVGAEAVVAESLGADAVVAAEGIVRPVKKKKNASLMSGGVE